MNAHMLGTCTPEVIFQSQSYLRCFLPPASRNLAIWKATGLEANSQGDKRDVFNMI